MTATTNHRRWLITGVSSGLGRALAEHVLDHGDTVIGTVRAARGEDAHSYVTSALQRRISGYANDRSWTTATPFETAKAR